MSGYKIVGEAQGYQPTPLPSTDGGASMATHITFFLDKYTCEPERVGLPNDLSVRITLPQPPPKFEGMTVQLTGDFENDDGTFSAHSIYVPALNYGEDAGTTKMSFATVLFLLIFGLVFGGIGVFLSSIPDMDDLPFSLFPWIFGLTGLFIMGLAFVQFERISSKQAERDKVLSRRDGA
jgi:hypothetical protein